MESLLRSNGQRKLVILDGDCRKEGSRTVLSFVNRQLGGKLQGSPLYGKNLFKVEFAAPIFASAYGEGEKFSGEKMHDALQQRVVLTRMDAIIVNADIREISRRGAYWVQGCVCYGQKGSDGQIFHNAINGRLGYPLTSREGTQSIVHMREDDPLRYSSISSVSLRIEYSFAIDNVKFSFFSKLANGVVEGIVEFFGIRLKFTWPAPRKIEEKLQSYAKY